VTSPVARLSVCRKRVALVQALLLGLIHTQVGVICFQPTGTDELRAIFFAETNVVRVARQTNATLLDESTLEVRITVLIAEAAKALALQVRPETSTEEYEQH
jgi:hypothetical protein